PGPTLPDKMPEPSQDAEPGSFCGAHYLYQTAPDERGFSSWSEDQPKDVYKAGETTISGQKALIVRKVKCYDGRRSFQMDSLLIQSQFLKDFLAKVMKGYPGLTFTLARVEFKSPFKPFIHRWDSLCQERDNIPDPTIKSHVDLLYGILKEELSDLISEISDLLKSAVMTHELLWALFEPEKVIYSVIDDRQRAFVFLYGDFDPNPIKRDFLITTRYIDSDGKTFGYRSQQLCIKPYEGTSAIMDLPVFPLANHKNQKKISTDLILRGKLWQSHKGYHYKCYEGLAKGYSVELQRNIKFKIDSRVAIDGEAFNTFNPDREITFSKTSSQPPVSGNLQDYQFNLMLLEQENKRRLKRNINSANIYPSNLDQTSAPNLDGGLVPHAGLSSDPTDETEGEISSSTLSDTQLIISTPVLRGFSLRDKMWLEFYIDGLKEILWNSNAFDTLVLPHGQQNLKRLILGFSRAQSNSRDTFDDVIKGKGRGIIMLLRGPPGVGKTLTAESVAEVMKVPLYSLSAGDLGTTAKKLESSLRNILKMVPRWGAIIVLDEADVFMEARNTIDLARNELVTIFLRLLEYYEGILFLTTNREACIDPAFESRIHLSIRYPELTTASRCQIWRQFTNDKGDQRLSEDELESVSVLDLNGRQIKNIVKIARLLAQEEASGLGFDHIQTILKLRGHGNAGAIIA
ncbi:P-loop containing nucleoside triphosphate hydrolase protein, partial [Penicillium malachiteum]